MLILKIFLAFLVPMLLGFLIISLFDRHQRISYFGKIVLGYVVGIGSIGIFMFFLGLLHLPLAATTIYAILLPILGLLLYFALKYKRFDALTFPKSFFGNIHSLWGKIFFVLFLVVFSYKLILGIVFVVQSPTYQDDALGRWNMRAKVFYYRQELVLDKQDNEYLGIPGQPYDLESEQYVPVRSYLPVNNLLKTWVAIHMGQYIDEYVNLINIVMYAFLILSVFYLMILVFDKKVASITAMALMGLPYLRIHATNPYADIFTATYFVVSLLITYIIITGEQQDKKNNVFRYIFMLLLVFLVLRKKEAMFYALISAFTMFLHNIFQNAKITLSSVLQEFKNIIYRPMVGSFIVLLYYLVRVGYLSVYMNHIDYLNEEYFHPDVFGLFLNVISYQGCFSLLGFFAVIIVAYYFRNIIKSKVKYLYLTFALLGGLMFYTFSSTNAHYEIINQTGVNRALVSLFSGLIVILMVTVFSNYHNIGSAVHDKIEEHK